MSIRFASALIVAMVVTASARAEIVSTAWAFQAGSSMSGIEAERSASVANARASITGGPTLTAEASMPDNFYYGVASAILRYGFHISLPGFAPPSGPAQFYIPLTITYAGNVEVSNSGTGGAYANAVLNVGMHENGFGSGPFDRIFNCTASSSGSTGCGGFGGTEAFSLLYYETDGTHEYYYRDWDIRMAADVSLSFEGGADYGATGKAWIDPVIAFAPDFLARNPDATITVDQLAAVPEPATWAMMVAGFGLVGGLVRRRPRQALA